MMMPRPFDPSFYFKRLYSLQDSLIRTLSTLKTGLPDWRHRCFTRLPSSSFL